MRFCITTIRVAVLAVCAISILGVEQAAAFRTYPRPGWMATVGWGFGRGTFENPSGERTGYRNGVAPQIRVDRVIGSHVQVGAEYQSWLIEFGDLPTKYRRVLQNLALAVSVYPGNPDDVSGGFYLRGGGGMGWTGSTEIELVEGEEQTSGKRRDEWGYGLFGAVGYDFWISRNFSAGAGGSFNWFDIGGDIVDRAWFSALALNLNLHF